MQKDIRKKTARAFAWDISGTLLQQGSGFIISIFLARLLTPEEFGLVGLSLVFISISQVFIDVGFSAALIQNQNNTSITYSSVFYLNIVAGTLLTIIFFLLSPSIAVFFERPDLTNITRALSFIFIFNSFSQVQSTILTKKLNFKILSIRTVAASIVGGIAGITAAFLGAGVYSLVIQSLSTALISTVLLWSTSEWRPDFKFSFNELKQLTAFSSFVFFDKFLSTIFHRIDTLFIGKVFSPTILGFYTRAESLNAQVTSYTSKSLSKVFFPVLSEMQGDDSKFKMVYFKVVSVVCFLSFLITGVLYILAEPIILGLFGDKWQFSVVLFQIIVFKSFNVPLNSMMLNALLSKGKSKENFYIGFVRKLIRSSSIIIGLLYGLIPFVWSITIVSYILTVYNAYYIWRLLNINIIYHLRKIFEGIVPIIVLVIASKFIADSYLYKTIMLVGFLIFYWIYAQTIKMEGFVFLKSEIVRRAL